MFISADVVRLSLFKKYMTLSSGVVRVTTTEVKQYGFLQGKLPTLNKL